MEELNKITEADKEDMLKNSEDGLIEEDTSESAEASDTHTPTDGSIQ